MVEPWGFGMKGAKGSDGRTLEKQRCKPTLTREGGGKYDE